MLNNYLGSEKELASFDTKKIEPMYEAAACLYAGKMKDIGNNIIYGTFKTQDDPSFFIMDELESFDVDYQWQFEVGEKLYNQFFSK